MVAGDYLQIVFNQYLQVKTSPNTKLDKSCQFCEYKKSCWPNLRMFEYSYGVEYLVHVEKEPKVPEITNVKSS